MNCEQMTLLISAWLDGETTAQEEKQMLEHLEQCAQCRALLEQLQTLRASFSDLEELSPARTLQTTPAGHIGSHVLRDQINSLGVRVQFVILTNDQPRRKAVCSKVAKWCRAGKHLSISDRPGQRLRVRCTSMPVITDTRDWWKPLSLTFTAYEAP